MSAMWRNLTLAGVLSLTACGEDEQEREQEDAHVHDNDHDHDHDDGEVIEGEEAEFVGCPKSIPAFALGMQATGAEGRITATLHEASNAPPLRYLNDWTVSFAGADGAALGDVEVVMARPFMPVHGHDGNIQPRVRALGEPGRFAVDSLNFIMRGPWEVQLTLRSATAGDDYVVFHVCVEE